MSVAHIPLNLGPGHERGHRVNNHHVHRSRSYQGLGDLQRLFSRVGLGDVQVVYVYSALAGIGRVQRVFHVNEGGHAAHLLGLGHDVLGQGGLAGGLGAVDLGDSSPGHTAYPKGNVQRNGPRWYGFHIEVSGLTQPDDGPIAKTLLDVE